MIGREQWRGLVAELKEEFTKEALTGWVKQTLNVPQRLHAMEVDRDLVVQRTSPPIHSISAILLVVAAVLVVATGLGILACLKRRRLAEARGEKEAKAKARAKAEAKTEAEAKAKAEAEAEAEANAKAEAKAKSLMGASRLWTSRNPAITDVRPWFEGVLVGISPDGNCFGTAWMVAALVWAVQRADTIAGLAAAIETARVSGAFSELEQTCQIHVAAFIGYVGVLNDCWAGGSTPDPVALAVEVIKTLLGSTAEGEGEGENWLSLKWGIAVVARALDVWCVGDGWERDELCTLRTFGESVDPLVGVDPMALSRPGGAGRDHGGLQPGGGLGLLLGTLSEYFVVGTGTRKTEDLTDLFRQDANAHGDEVVTGVKLFFRSAVHHYDVLVEAGTALEVELRKEFGLQLKPFDPAEGTRTLRDGVASQEVTLPCELLDFVGGKNGLEEQKAALEVMSRIHAAKRQVRMYQ